MLLRARGYPLSKFDSGLAPKLPELRRSTVLLHDVPNRRRPSVPFAENNLGELNRFVAEDTSAQDWNRVDPSSFADQGLYVDGSVVFASTFLLLLLLAFTFQRILGLDRLVASMMLSAQERKRTNNNEAREMLERSLDKSEDDK